MIAYRRIGEYPVYASFQLSMGVAKNPSRVNLARKDLARAKTVQGERAKTKG